MPAPLDSLFGGGLSLPSSGLLSGEDQKQLRNAALVHAGLALAGGVGGFFPALEQGLKAGEDSYQGGIKNAFAGAQAENSLATAAMQRMQAMRLMEYRSKLPPMPDPSDPDAIRKWINVVMPLAIANGDTQALGPLSEISKTLAPKTPTKVENVAGSDPSLKAAYPNVDPKKVYTVQRDIHGNIVGEPLEQGMPPAAKGEIALREMGTPLQMQRMKNQIVSSYESQLSQMKTTAAVDAWGQLKNVFARAEAGNPTADDIMGLIDGIMRLNNPGATVRSSTLQIALSKIGDLPEKVQSKVRMAYAHGWPPEMVKSIEVAARGIAEEHQKQAADARQRAIRRGIDAGLPADEMNAALRDPWTIVGTDSAAPAPAGPSPLAGYNFGGFGGFQGVQP